MAIGCLAWRWICVDVGLFGLCDCSSRLQVQLGMCSTSKRRVTPLLRCLTMDLLRLGAIRCVATIAAAPSGTVEQCAAPPYITHARVGGQVHAKVPATTSGQEVAEVASGGQVPTCGGSSGPGPDRDTALPKSGSRPKCGGASCPNPGGGTALPESGSRPMCGGAPCPNPGGETTLPKTGSRPTASGMGVIVPQSREEVMELLGTLIPGAHLLRCLAVSRRWAMGTTKSWRL